MRKSIDFASCPRISVFIIGGICTMAILAPARGQVWGQESPANKPSARYSHSMAYDLAHGQTVLFGGEDANFKQLGDTWVWDGIIWTQKKPNTSPSPRSGFAMAYDSAHGQVVLFGGYTGSTFLADTWVWDGNDWAQKTPITSPPARWLHAMAYDSAHGQVVLFGGQGLTQPYLSDTWLWDGNNWTENSPAISPYPRQSPAMAYDSLHGQTVLFGGASSAYFGDTWVWDGTKWIQKSPTTSPSPRYDHAMAFDSTHSQTVLFGGSDNTAYFGDTWLWDGTNWTKQSPVSNPPGRILHALAYDASHGQVVLFGGQNNDILNDTWIWEDGFFVNPSSGSGAGPQVFMATYFDTNGATDLQAVYIEFGSVGDAPHNCKVAYIQASNTLDLFNDADTGVVGSVVLGGGGSVSNSQCTVLGGSTPATVSGINLTVPFQIQFLPGYGGLKTIAGLAQSYSGTQSNGGNLSVLGSWTPAASTPSVMSVSTNPNTGTGTTAVFTVTYSDTGGGNDLQAVYLTIGPVLNGANSCAMGYDPGNNELYLFNDAGTGALTLNGGSRSQCEQQSMYAVGRKHAGELSGSGNPPNLNGAL